jgi:hypothetical protein
MLDALSACHAALEASVVYFNAAEFADVCVCLVSVSNKETYLNVYAVLQAFPELKGQT